MNIWDEITKPSLLLSERIAKTNIQKMADKAKRHHLSFRPHFKTHQSASIGEWFREIGVEKIAVSSIEMAAYFQKHGWKDIAVAFPINLREIDRINALATKCTLSVLVSAEGVSKRLSEMAQHSLGVWLEIDTGYGRSGFPDNGLAAILNEIKMIDAAENLHFKGLLIHNGHSYKCKGQSEIKGVHEASIKRLRILKKELQTAGVSNFEISLGDTPTCAVAENFDGIDEIRPGNFIFYDLTQASIGSCALTDIAVVLACPVVAVYPARNQLVVHGGGVHLSKDSLQSSGHISYGRVVLPTGELWNICPPSAFVSSISQEHGILSMPAEMLQNIQVGDILGILPVHSCMTADLMRGYYLLEKSSAKKWLPMMKAEALHP